METQKKPDPRRWLTPPMKVGFIYAFEPSTYGNNTKFKATGFLKKVNEKGEPTDIKIFMNPIWAALAAKFGSDKKKWPKKYKKPIKDGDNPKYAGKEGYKGHWVIECNHLEQPEILKWVNGEAEPLTDKKELYPGVIASLRLYASVYEWPEGSEVYGTKFNFDGIVKFKDSTPFGGRVRGKEAYGALAAYDTEELEDEHQEEMNFGDEDEDTQTPEYEDEDHIAF